MDSDDLADIENRFLEVQAMQICISAEIRALKLLSTKIWEQQGVRMPDNRPIDRVLRTMTDEQIQNLLSSFADFKPEHAARLKTVIEKSLRWQDPFK